MRRRVGTRRGLAALAIERDPDLVRGLGSDLVDAQRGEQADDGVRRGGGHHRDRLELVRLDLGEPIEAAPELLDRALGDRAAGAGGMTPRAAGRHAAGRRPRPPQRSSVPWSGAACPWRNDNRCRHIHASADIDALSMRRNVGTSAQVPTFVTQAGSAPSPPPASARCPVSMARMSASISSSGRGGV